MPKQTNNSKLRRSQKQKKDVSNIRTDSDMPNFTSTWTHKTIESEECQDLIVSNDTDPLLEESYAEMPASDVEKVSKMPSETKSSKRSKNAKLTPEQALQRKIKARQRVAKETFEQRLKRLKALSEYQRERIRNETPEQRKRRLQILRDNQARRLKNETPEMREIRLSKGRVYCKNLRKKSIDVETVVENESETSVKRSGRRKVNEAEEI